MFDEVEEAKAELNLALEALSRVSNLVAENHIKCDGCEGLRTSLEGSREEVEALLSAKHELEERLAEVAAKGKDSVEAMVDMDRISKENQGLRETLECRYCNSIVTLLPLQSMTFYLLFNDYIY